MSVERRLKLKGHTRIEDGAKRVKEYYQKRLSEHPKMKSDEKEQ